MSEFNFETSEILGIKALLAQIDRQLAAQSAVITRAYNRLGGQKGTEVAAVRNRIVAAGKEYDAQWMRVREIHNFLDYAMEMIASAEQGALSEFQTVQITVDASGLTESGDETDVLKAAETTHVGYGDIVKEYVEGKVQAYIDTISIDNTWAENALGWGKWFWKDLYGDLNGLKEKLENAYREYKGEKIELLPENVNQFFDTLSDGMVAIKTSEYFREFVTTGDGWQAYTDIATLWLEESGKKVDKWLDKKNGIEYVGVAKDIKKILLKTIVKMPKNYRNALQDYVENNSGTAGSIVVDTTVGTLMKEFANAYKGQYKVATALAYPIADAVMENGFGYDLSREYERLTGKTGLEAVFEAQKELWVDIVYGGVKKQMAQGVDGFYQAVSEGWNNWKSGIRVMFGG